nr:hypothetical protein [Pararhodobacter sp.]
MRSLFDGDFNSWRSLDHILGFFLKARHDLDFTECPAFPTIPPERQTLEYL